MSTNKRLITKMRVSLNCILLGKTLSDIFTIDVGQECDIDGNIFHFDELKISHLKYLIWKKKEMKQHFDDFDIMKLWKTAFNLLNPELPAEEKIRNNDNELMPFRPLKDYFPDINTADKYLIIVELPATTGKRKLEEDEDEEDEFRAKKEKLKKIGFHIPTGSLRGSLEIQQQDEEKYRNLVNSLPNINIEDKLFKIPRLPGDIGDTYIYNRECYKYLCNFILEDTKFKRYLVTGNPGVGKTFFGRLMLTELLKKDKSVLLDYETFTVWIHPSGEIYNVENKTLYRQMAEQPNVWCIIDGKRDQVGHDFSNGKLIMVSSPKKAIIGDFAKQWCRELFMPTWNEDELEYCWEHLYKEKLTLDSLKDKFKVCGGIARWIFTMSLADIEMAIEKAIKTVKSEILYHQGQVLSGDEFTHKLIHIHTNIEETGKFSPYTESTCFFASKYVADRCLEQLQLNHKKELFDFINNAKDITQLGGFRGTLFELVAHTIIRQGGDFRVRELKDDGTGIETIHCFDTLEEKFFENVEEIQGQVKYCRPTKKNFESIDSYAHPNNLFQVTVSKKHGIKQDGLRAIKGILDESFGVTIYFVLPREIFETFKRKQSYENKGEGKVFDSWIYDITQYSLCVNLEY